MSAPKASAAALKAIALNETDADAHVALAIEDQWYEWDAPSYTLAVYLNTDSRLDNLRSDGRFLDLRRRIGLPAL